MNIIYLHCHDMGRVNSAYGFPAPTPNIRAFAEKSLLFRNAYCAAPTCSPSRAALLTGLYPHQCGMLGLVHRGFGLKQPDRHLAKWLQNHGYYSALCGIQHEVPESQILHIYNERIQPIESPGIERDEASALAVKEFLAKRAKEKQPFFLAFGTFFPHRDFPELDRSVVNPDYVNVLPPLPNSPETRQDVARYYQAVAQADAALGVVLEAIFENGLGDNTLILLTTDHGVAFPGAKCNLTDSGIGVTFALRLPGSASIGKVTDAMISQVDFFPTICELLEKEPPEPLPGRSLMPALRGEAFAGHDTIFAEVTFHASYEPMRCVRTPRYKYIRFFDQDRRQRLANIDDGESKTVLQEAGKFTSGHAEEELYDLLLDPNEQVNLAQHPDHQIAKEQFQQCLHQWMEQTQDPLLQGPILLPSSAKVNSVNSQSPSQPTHSAMDRPKK